MGDRAAGCCQGEVSAKAAGAVRSELLINNTDSDGSGRPSRQRGNLLVHARTPPDFTCETVYLHPLFEADRPSVGLASYGAAWIDDS